MITRFEDHDGAADFAGHLADHNMVDSITFRVEPFGPFDWAVAQWVGEYREGFL